MLSLIIFASNKKLSSFLVFCDLQFGQLGVGDNIDHSFPHRVKLPAEEACLFCVFIYVVLIRFYRYLINSQVLLISP